MLRHPGEKESSPFMGRSRSRHAHHQRDSQPLVTAPPVVTNGSSHGEQGIRSQTGDGHGQACRVRFWRAGQCLTLPVQGHSKAGESIQQVVALEVMAAAPNEGLIQKSSGIPTPVLTKKLEALLLT